MKSHIDLVKTDSIHLGVREMLQAPPSILIGVDAATSSVLQALGIATVFDLATSRLFANAALIAEAGTNASSLFARHGAVAAGVVDPEALGERVEDLYTRSIAVLEGISEADAAAFASAAGVEVIRDLALWPPYLAARSLVHAEYVPSMADDADPEAPPDLLPKSGDYPTERVFYSTLVFDRVLSGDGANDAGPGDLVSAGRIDLTPATDPNLGFDAPALGAVLTFEQSWYAKGVTLGQLLHSVALAPGESTRIAVVDWSRRTRGVRDERTTQTESLSNSMQHSRALSEVTDAVAVEAQTGFSTTETTSKTKQAGAGGGFSIGPVTVGGSASGASTTTSATSFASSFGRRSIAADYSQKIVDRTQQHANSVRNRRASVVQEVSQSEHETVSTRVITNYNHMHALSVQYYEVVQVYRMAVRMAKAERCLFIPLQLVDFSKPVFVEKYRDVLIDAAIDVNARRLLTTDYGVVEIIPGRPATPPKLIPTPILPGVLTGSTGTVFAAPLTDSVSGAAVAAENAASPAVTLPTLTMGATATSLSSEIRSGWNVEQLDKLSWLFSRPVFRPKHLSASVPDDTLVIGIRIENAQLDPIVVERAGGAAPLTVEGRRSVTFDPPVPITELVSIRAANKANEEIETDVVLTLMYMGTTFPLNVPAVAAGKAKKAELVRFSGTRASNELVEHLKANRLHYSQAIYRSLDAAALALLLSPYQFEGRPVIEQIDPLPVTITGNYLVFRNPAEIRQQSSDDGEAALTDWGIWLSEHGLLNHAVADDIVPLPSGGVFAEAVLGRFNSAEKLDITRFWNWQDSPIPIQAPDIAAIQLGSRAQAEHLTPGELAQPLINVINPAPFPDPSGLSAVLAAIGKGDMFRDMSGLASTIGLAQAALQASGAGATAAGAQAGANLATIAQLEAEKFKATMALVGAAMGVPVSPGGASSISGQGAKINHGKSLDSRDVGPPAGGSGASPGGSGAGSSGGGSNGGGNGASGGGSTTTPAAPAQGGSYEAAGFTEALWGPTGESLGGFATKVVEAAYMPGPGATTLHGAATLQCPVGERVLQSPAEFVTEIAAIMRSRDWTQGAEYQEFWFSHPANQLIGEHKLGLGTTGPIDVKEIDLDWVLSFPRAQELYARISSPDVYANQAARAVIRRMLDARFAASGPATVILGDVTKTGQALEDEYCNHLALGNAAAYNAGLDALAAALGRFTLYVIPTGTATRDAQGTHVEIRDVGIYLRDSFDFNGDQDLGWWQKPDYVQATTGPHRRYFPACSNELIPMTNAAYRQYRQQTDLGRDFLIYSNVKVETRPPIQFDY